MKKLVTVFLMTLVFLLVGLQETSMGKVYAENVNFSGVTAPMGCNARLQPSTNSRAVYTIPGSTNVNFEGWVTGDPVQDYWTGEPDNKWFFYTDRNYGKVYVASGGIDGNPPTDPTDPTDPTGSATVPEVKQQMSNWCWAATTSAVLQHYGFNVTQQQVVSYIKGGLVNQTGTESEMVNAAKHFGLYANAYYTIPSYSSVQSEIGNGNPLLSLISWTQGGGHAEVLDGCYSNGGRNYVQVMDPWYGDHFDYTFEEYKSNSQFSWGAYIGGFRRN